jgi:uncharacterized paraquat-inducible protein A
MTESEEEDDLAPCPSCRAMIYAEADRCPRCGDYVTPGTARARSKPWWMWLGIALALLILLSWAFGKL